MKKKINIIYLLFMLFLVLLNYITKNSNILNLVLSSSLSILLYNIFSELNIKSTLEKYKNKYKIYSKSKYSINRNNITYKWNKLCNIKRKYK